MLFLLVLVAFFAFSSAQQSAVPKDVDVFNLNYNRNQRNARAHILRSFDVIPTEPEPSWKASASLVGGNDDPEQQGGGGVMGEITFKQWRLNSPIQVSVNISGLKAGKHAIHIHAFGDITDGCKSTGSHFRHSIVGNVEADGDGKAEVKFNTLGLELFGVYGILGRSIVVHEKPSEFLKYPDLFSPETELSFQTEEDQVGERLACGIVTITSNF